VSIRLFVRAVEVRASVALALFGFTSVLAACAGKPRVAAPGGLESSAGVGAVVSEHPEATRVGLAILDAGGNAVDAAVATALALAVVYPQAGNLGGGGFAVVVPAGQPEAAATLDFRETAPAKLLAADFRDENDDVVEGRSTDTHLGVGVPGSPDGLWRLHQRFGRLEWEALVVPAVRLARGGFAVDPHLARDLRVESLRQRLTRSSAARALFYPDGEPLSEGARLTQPELARTLELLAAQGPDGFYRGPVADALTAEMRRADGRLEQADLDGYESRWREPLRGTFDDLEVICMPPPSSGGVALLQVLGMVERLDPPRSDAGPSGAVAHLWAEAMRRAFADRAMHLGDPDFSDVPVEALLSDAWLDERAASLGPKVDMDVAPWARPPAEGGGETTHLCVLDAEGNAVSLTTTLNTTFGTGILVPGAGFLLNNELDDFSLKPGVPNAYGLVGQAANQIEGGKRPLSSMTPAVLLDKDGRVRMVVGSPGGPRIITAVLQVVLRHVWHDQAIAEAIEAPRLHQQWRPASTRLEPGWSPAVIADLEERGHELDLRSSRWSSVQGITVDARGRVAAHSDSRRGGAAGVQGQGLSQPARP
jgi:gamma-glutamyltranspeptidase/glutathione hydrolase